VRAPRFPRRRRRSLSIAASLWYPDGDRARRAALETCAEHLRPAVADLAGPVPGTVTLRRDEWGWESGFHTEGGVMVPAGVPGGGLFVTHLVAPQNLNVRTGAGVDLCAWLVVPPLAPPAVHERLTAAGWRLGRPRSHPSG
jgi:hypothetical protein